MKRITALAGLWVAASLALAACAALKTPNGMASRHPEALGKGRPTCTSCHEEDVKNVPMKSLDHTLVFLEDHRFPAYQQERVCGMCHQPSFCADCHQTNRVELKPSVRNHTDTYRRFPHEGDFLSRHRFEARIDPTSCVRCHGNPKASKTCTPCHGRLP